MACPASVVADAGLDCQHDDALSAAAGALLLRGRSPDSQTLVQAVRDASSDAVFVRALFLPSEDPDKRRAWLQEFRAQADAVVACGDAQGSAGQLLIVSARAGTLADVDRKLGVVRGTLSEDFSDPELVISEANGKLTRLGIQRRMLKDGIPLSDELVWPLKLQLVAHGRSGPRPVAERVVGGGAQAGAEEPNSHNTSASLPSDAPLTAASDLNLVLGSLRMSHDANPLRANRLLAGVADTHAHNVCAAGHVAHELTPGENPQARLLEAGISARLVGETVARARDGQSAFAQLEDSPSHMLTLLEPRFTDAGIGTATDASGKLCVVVLLAAWPRYVGR